MELEHLVQGKYYHIFNRGNNGCRLFYNQGDYEHFLHLYDKYITPVADTLAWALMGNHFHLLVYIKPNLIYKYALPEMTKNNRKVAGSDNRKWETMDLSGLWELGTGPDNIGKNHIIPVPHRHFAHLFNAYNRYLQVSTGRTGNLFERPFKRKWIDNEIYLKQAILYIHNNPVHHGFCEHPLEYPWTSYITCTSEKPTRVKRDDILKLFGNREKFKHQHSGKMDIDEIEEWLEIKGHFDFANDMPHTEYRMQTLTGPITSTV